MYSLYQHQIDTLIPLQLTQIEGYSEIYDNAAYGISFTFDHDDEPESEANGIH